MTDLIPRGLTDLFVYFVPGAALLATVIYAFAPNWLKRGEQKVGLGEAALALLLTFLLGVVLFRVSEFVIWPFSWLLRRGVLEGVIADFPDSQGLCAGLSSKLQIDFKTNIDCYRFASQLVHDRAPRSAETAERLLAFSLMARSLLLGVPVAAGVLIWRFRRSRWWAVASVLATGLILEALFAKIFLVYWSAAVWRVLRSYVVWRAFG